MVGDVRYYTDEHVSRAIIRGIRQRGVDVLSVPEAKMQGAIDQEHLVLAGLEGRVLFTQDDDFLRLASSGVAHAGIAYARQGTSTGAIIRGLMLIHQVLNAEEMVGKVEYL